MSHFDPHTKGAKYEVAKDMDSREIAAEIRADLKAAKLKGTVRVQRYSGGCTIHVTLKAAQFAGEHWIDLIAALDCADRIVRAYRWDDGDSLCDRASTNFYYSVYVATSLTADQPRCSTSYLIKARVIRWLRVGSGAGKPKYIGEWIPVAWTPVRPAVMPDGAAWAEQQLALFNL